MVLQRFLIVTYPVQSHINPSLQLAKRLIAMGAHVTIFLSLHLYRRITNKISIPGLSFLPFSDGYDAGFSVVRNALSDYNLYIANEGQPFTCILYILLLPWIADVAHEFNLPTALIWIEPATVLDILYHYFHGYADYINSDESHARDMLLPGLSLSLSPHDLPSFLLLQKPSLLSFALPFFESQILQLDKETSPTVLVSTFEALEEEALRAIDKINMIPIGPLIPSAFLDGKDPTDTSFGGDIFPSDFNYIEWLDSKEEKTVVYVSFGSYLELSKRQMQEIARGLLDCGSPFLLVIREKVNSKVEDGNIEEGEEEEEEELCFREELKQRGKIVTWCSQVEVLPHPSVGCFLTHCGWNSTLESLVSGVPMVAFPQWKDQMTNAKLREDVWKIGVRVDHEVAEDGIVVSKEIKRCLEVVMRSAREKGNDLRKNAEKWKGLAMEAAKEGGSSEKSLRAFADDVGQKFMNTHVAEK